MYLEINSNNQVMGYSDNETSNAVKTDKSVPEFTDTQILKFVNGDFVVEDSQALIDKKIEYDAQEYARNRQAEYPSIHDVTVALAEKAEGRSAMWDEITAQRLDVKSKYPKP